MNFLVRRYLLPSSAALVCSCLTAVWAGTSAFPGAEGFGANAIGGRGGRVIQVTNLNDSGPGSLRAALEAEGPRVVVFRVAGTIELMTELVVTHPFLTLAGQSAPGGGITLKTHPSNTRSALTIARGCHDVIIRHLRSRPGPHQGFPRRKDGRAPDTSEVKDALQILGARNVIVDHCSFSWATDEVVSTFYDTRDVTIQWCVISEALRKSRPDQSLPGKGLLIGSKGGGRISVHHNLMAHNIGRNPLIKCGGLVDVVNNVVLAPDKVAMAIDAEHGRSPANFVGNYVQAPKADGLAHGLAVVGGGSFSLFLKDNLGPHRLRAGQPEALFVNASNNGRRWITDEPHDAPPVKTASAAAAFERVLSGAGCTRPRRDSVDQRLVDEVRQGITRLVNDPADVGGWPALEPGAAPRDTDRDGMPDGWEAMHGLDPVSAADGPQDTDGDGYTNVEEFLNETDPGKREAGAIRRMPVTASRTVRDVGATLASRAADASRIADHASHIPHSSFPGPDRAVSPDSNQVVATYSIVAFDQATGDLGVAVQSKFFGVGTVVPWARAGVGAIATQASANVRYGPEGLKLLASGKNARETVKVLTEADEGRDTRQLGIVDAQGNTAGYTGAKCFAWAGHLEGTNFCVQGNILAGEEVVKAMAVACTKARAVAGSELADWLMAALQAGEDAGGDRRGRQSAALLVVRDKAGYGGASDRYIDLRVEDHPDPTKELARLLEIHKRFYAPAHQSRSERRKP